MHFFLNVGVLNLRDKVQSNTTYANTFNIFLGKESAKKIK